MRYPVAYHRACQHLVAFGGYGGNTTKGRQLCADALWAMRRVRPTEAQKARHGMLFISGQFPVKASN